MMRHSIFLSEKVVRCLMKRCALIVPKPKRRRYSSYLGEVSPAPARNINRDFQAAAPNEKWLTDISEFHIRAGKVYLSPIIDCLKGLVISWAIRTTGCANVVNTMLDAAVETIADSEVLPVIHCDCASHYRGLGWLERIDAAKIVRSKSRKARSQDNAACEGFFGRLKTEFFYPCDWRAFTAAQFVDEVDAFAASGHRRWPRGPTTLSMLLRNSVERSMENLLDNPSVRAESQIRDSQGRWGRRIAY